MSRLTAVLEQFEAKNKEQTELLTKINDTPAEQKIAPEDVARAEALGVELAELKGEIELGKKSASMTEQARARDAYLNQPVTLLPYQTGTGVTAHVAPHQAPPPILTEIEEKFWDQQRLDQLHAIRKDDYKGAFNSLIHNQWSGMTNAEQKVLQVGSDPAGGFLVPEDSISRIIAPDPAPTRFISRVTRFRTTRDALNVPRVIYTDDEIYSTGMRATFTGEIPASATVHRVTEPVFGSMRIPVYTAMMSLPVTLDLIEDSAIDIVSWIEDKFRETIALLQENMAINGTGVGQPAGILMNPGGTDQPDVIPTGDASTILPDSLIDIGMDLPEQYDENAVYVFNKRSGGKTIAKLKDSDDRYLWGMGTHDSGLSPAVRGRNIIGYDTLFSAFMPNVAANAYPLFFGDPRGYVLVERIGLSIRVLTEVYAEVNQVVILGRVRFGGALVEPWRIKVLQVAAA
jgi:HK97 family phage major capsid protein